jgi:ABC-type polysaccharide/polyol phosphate transport system ATPase subunit
MTTSDDVVLSIQHVSKRYHMVAAAGELKTTLLHPRSVWQQRRRDSSLWAVRDVTFDVGRGEFFSIIGANGSGKSTLLRLIAGLSRPSEGTVTASGRLSTLLELGAGFHPNVSGRENAIINGLLIGMSRDEIEALLPEIVAFAGLKEFIDQPMRTYSSGMYVRLGFAITVFMEPEILLVDEILAVGDSNFQEKCFAHIARLRAQGVTIVMVSHDLNSVERFSTRAALMERGRMIAIGDPSMVVERHLERLGETSPEIRRAIDDSMRTWTDADVERLFAASPKARERFERGLEQHPAFQEAMAQKAADNPATTDRSPGEDS